MFQQDGVNGSITTTLTTAVSTGSLLLPTSGLGTVGIDVRGTFTATLVPEATIDGTNFFTITINPVAGTAGVTSITAAGAWTVPITGYKSVRLQCSAYTSGTAVCTFISSQTTGSSNNITLATGDLEIGAVELKNATTDDRAIIDASGNLQIKALSGTIASGALASGSIAAGAIAAGASSFVKLEDAASADADAGVSCLTVRKNTAASTSGTDGDYQPVITDTNGAVWASLATKLDSTNDSITAVVASGGIASGAIASGALASGSVASGALASGSIASGALASGSIAAGAIAAGASSIADNEDVASADGDRGVKILVTQKATPANTAGTDGDYEFLQQSGGKLWVGADLKQIAGTTIVNGGVAGSQSIGGTVATNVAITANPINLGAQAVSSENSAATTARQVQLVADLVGKLIVMPYANPENFVSGAITTAMTGTTSTSLIASPGGSLRNYITSITVSNAHATVGTDIIIQDGSGGTTLWTIPAAAVYGGGTISFPTPLRQPTTATAIFAQNVTTGASTKVSACGYKGL